MIRTLAILTASSLFLGCATSGPQETQWSLVPTVANFDQERVAQVHGDRMYGETKPIDDLQIEYVHSTDFSPPQVVQVSAEVPVHRRTATRTEHRKLAYIETIEAKLAEFDQKIFRMESNADYVVSDLAAVFYRELFQLRKQYDVAQESLAAIKIACAKDWEVMQRRLNRDMMLLRAAYEDAGGAYRLDESLVPATTVPDEVLIIDEETGIIRRQTVDVKTKLAAQQRVDYIDEIERSLVELDRELITLNANAECVIVDNKAAFDKALLTLNQRRKMAGVRLALLKRTHAVDWKAFQPRLDAAMTDLRAAHEDALGAYRLRPDCPPTLLPPEVD